MEQDQFNSLKIQAAEHGKWYNVGKKKILLLALHYPLTISKYFERAFSRRDDVELVTVGPYSGQYIPWGGGQTLPAKYAIPPIINIGDFGHNLPYELVEARLDGFIPDLVLNIDAGIHWTAKPKVNCPVAHVATDPHVLQAHYELPRSYSDKFFNMQKFYSKPGDVYLPYAFDPTVHYPLDGNQHFFNLPDRYIDNQHVDGAVGVYTTKEKDYDAVLVGMAYPNRVEWVNRLRAEGIFVAFENGPIFDEYRELANSATIGLNWSSLDDMVARVFEIMAMGLVPVINRVPDLKEFFIEDVHYLGFSGMDEAIAKVKWAKENPSNAAVIAENAKKLVWDNNHTYDSRCQTIMQECGLI